MPEVPNPFPTSDFRFFASLTSHTPRPAQYHPPLTSPHLFSLSTPTVDPSDARSDRPFRPSQTTPTPRDHKNSAKTPLPPLNHLNTTHPTINTRAEHLGGPRGCPPCACTSPSPPSPPQKNKVITHSHSSSSQFSPSPHLPSLKYLASHIFS